ncbi:hypothetical protein LCGC14_0557490 [marine sediment metagenome]|uniref:Uncharacterized protein n=1 Tax=marine sediment metagenome TaxID=412755 RepID=A0A0F9UWB2_9ZZZZ
MSVNEAILTNADPAIREALQVLLDAGIETFESCQGGSEHSFHKPTIRFHGNNMEGFRAYAAASNCGLRVYALRRVYDIVDGELTGPWWELVFHQSPVSR